MGEKFNQFNQKGLVCQNAVEEKFCYQGEKTYCPAPFFCTDSGFGLLVDTDEVTTFDFTGDAITVLLPIGVPVFTGTGSPAELVRAYMLRPLVYGWPEDATAAVCDDEFMLGDSLLVAPLLEENATGRKVYLPSGQWYSLFTHECTKGGQTVLATLPGKLPVWVRGGCGLALHLAPGGGLGSDVGNAVHASGPLHFVFAGESGSTTFYDDSGTALHFAWQNGALCTQPAGTAFTCEFLL